ncbi:MAG: hypothetical protein JXM70_08165 [Pirellulales bacterium]|nr:hypothetical protein [Pirellulales bacterium]
MFAVRMCFFAVVSLGMGNCLNAADVEVTVTWPRVTLGHGDQFPWTQLAGGDHLTVVNDGRGPYIDIGDTIDRHAVTRQKHGMTFNHKVFRIRGMNLDDLKNPRWITDEYGYGKAPSEFDRLGAYCFGILALGDRHVILPLALRNYPGKGGKEWGGCAWVITEDGGATWRFRSGKTLAAKDWKADRGVPLEDTTFAHTERGVFTMVNPIQMGPGYQWNRTFSRERGIRGYVFAFMPNGHINDRGENHPPYQRELILARCKVGEGKDLAVSHVFDPNNWQFYAGVGADGTPAWSDLAGRQPVPMDVPYPIGWSTSGQSWYSSCIYLKSVDRFVLIGTGFVWPDAGPSAMYIHVARNPWGPWRLAWHTHKATLRNNPSERPFSPYWIPGFCDLDAGVDDKGRLLRDCFFSVAGIGDTRKGWITETMPRYGVNIGRIRFAFNPPTRK